MRVPDVHREVLECLSLRSNDFGFEIEFSANVARARLRIYEIGISSFGRTYAEGKKIRARHIIAVVAQIFVRRFVA